jgi:hypothetical protein
MTFVIAEPAPVYGIMPMRFLVSAVHTHHAVDATFSQFYSRQLGIDILL